MAQQPQLDFTTQARLAAFALEMKGKHSAYGNDVVSLRNTLENRLPPAVRDELVEKLNRDPSGTIDKIRQMVDRDPKMLAEFNKDPMKLAAAVGVKAPAVAAPPAPAANAPAGTAGTAAPQTAAPAVTVAAPAKPLSPAQIKTEDETLTVYAEISKAKGYQELMQKAEKDPALQRALNAAMGSQAKSPEESLASLKEFRDALKKNPDMLANANQMLDATPPQLRDNILTKMAENPQMARDVLSGDPKARSELMVSALMGGKNGPGGFIDMFKNMFKGGGNGFDFGMGGGFSGLKRLLEGLAQGFMGMLGGIGGRTMSFAGAPQLMGVSTNNFQTTTRPGGFAQTVDMATSSRSDGKPILDASKPEQPAVTVAELRVQGQKPEPDGAKPATPQLDAPRQNDPFSRNGIST
jgi:hypothetical protein